MVIETCTQCPRNCRVRREETEGKGFCRMGALPVVARAALHQWEEPAISGTRGSGTVFFTGCSLQCVFCQNYSISTRREVGKVVTPRELHDIFLRLIEQGAHNINLVNPTHFALPIAEALAMEKLPVPVVYNCGGYESLETLQKLEGLVDIYLPDLKYATDELGQKYSGAPDYFTRASAAILEMVRQTGPARYTDDGMMKSGTLVRHLILPGNTRNSIAVLHWLHDHLPENPVSLMSQYVPCGRAPEYPEINRRARSSEIRAAEEYFSALNLDGFTQELLSATEGFIPDFDLTGV